MTSSSATIGFTKIITYKTILEVHLKRHLIEDHKKMVLELVIWLCKAIRMPVSVNPPKVSSSRPIQIPWKWQEYAPGDGHPGDPRTSFNFMTRYCLSRKPLTLPEGSCWLPLLELCTITEMTQQEEGLMQGFRGLRMSFELMIRMAAVEYPVPVKDTIVLCGYETALTPTRVVGSCAQFHLDISTSGQINPYLLTTTAECNIKNVEDFRGMTCYVGWCQTAHIRLGTRQLPARVEYTSLRDRKRTLRWHGVTIGGQMLSAAPFQAGITGQGNFSFVSNRLAFTPADSFVKLLKDTSKQLSIILDVKERCSWLVPKLSLLLHMAHTWVGDAVDPIPFAKPHLNGAEVVSACIRAGDTTLAGEGPDKFKLRTLMLGLNINLLRSIEHLERSEGKSVHGFEFRDIVGEPGKGGFMKKLSIKAEGKNWIGLLNEVDAVVVCAGIGQVIAPADDQARKCLKCNAPPSGHDYLAAPLSCLELLVQRKGRTLEDLSKSAAARAFVSDEHFWTLSGNPFSRCAHNDQSTNTCWDRDDILQRLSKASRFRRPDVDIGETKPREFPSFGAVVFGTRMHCSSTA